MLAVALLLVSCGSDDSGAAASTTSEAVAPVASKPGDHMVALAFWPGSQLDTTSGAPLVPATSPPRITLEFTWIDPTECFVWVRDVAASAGGGTRSNTATDFELRRGADDAWIFTYRQNASRCGEGFATDGTVKTFRSDVLTEDPSTGQTGDALWAGVVEVVTP
jgi:hypothetical protein